MDQIHNIKKYSIIAILVLSGLMILVWLSTHSRMTITMTGNSSQPTTYKLVSDTGASTTGTFNEQSTTQIVSKGKYQIIIQQGEKSYVRLVSTPGFLGRIHIQASPKSELSRKYIGNNPRYCMHYIGERLVSADCGQDFQAFQLHVPASTELSTYVEPILGNGIIGTSEGIVETKLGTIAVVRAEYSHEGIYGHYAHLVDGAVKSLKAVKLEGLDFNRTYNILAYKEGFVAYDSKFEDIFYISSLAVPPVRLDIKPPKGETLYPYILDARGKTLAVAYSPYSEGYQGDTDEEVERARAENTALVIVKDGKQRTYETKGVYSALKICTDDYICTLSGSRATIHSLDGKQLIDTYEYQDVRDLQVIADHLKLVTDDSVVSLDLSSGEGFVDYTFSEYEYCGMQSAGRDYVLCILTGKTGKSALYIGSSDGHTDDIDKRILEASKDPAITTISIYGQFITIAPEYGDPLYDPVTGLNRIDPGTRRKINDRVRTIITGARLNQEPYVVRNTGE
ncbi:MAG TPA: hypothetical protein VK983_03735 [Candidatus Limnocylindrales bacterium]|nr:hypothetical protein [Candidatus Limnocylindrales bacterium]